MIKAGSAKTGVKLPTAATPSKNDQVRSLRDRLTEALQSKGYLTKPTKGQYVYQGVEDVYDKTVIFYNGDYNELYACNYTLDGEKITLTAKVAVQRKTIYVEK